MREIVIVASWHDGTMGGGRRNYRTVTSKGFVFTAWGLGQLLPLDSSFRGFLYSLYIEKIIYIYIYGAGVKDGAFRFRVSICPEPWAVISETPRPLSGAP